MQYKTDLCIAVEDVEVSREFLKSAVHQLLAFSDVAALKRNHRGLDIGQVRTK